MLTEAGLLQWHRLKFAVKRFPFACFNGFIADAQLHVRPCGISSAVYLAIPG